MVAGQQLQMTQSLHHSQEYDTLPYPSTTMAQNSHIDTPMTESWEPSSHHSPPNSSCSSGQSSQGYAIAHQTTGHIDYASPSAPVSFAHNRTDLYSQHLQPSISSGESNHAMSMNLDQVENSVGSNRVTRSRRQRMLEGESPSNVASGSQDVGDHQNAGSSYYASAPFSRPQTPNSMAEQNRYAQFTNPLSISRRLSQSIQSPGGSPLSPGYSSFGFNHSASRSASNSTSNPRSASPALSAASSALTSLSSSASARGPGPYAYDPYPRQARHSKPYAETYQAHSSPEARQKHKKAKLTNADRKAICQYAKEHPTARQEDIAVVFGVERSTVSKTLKMKAKYMNLPDGDDLQVSKHRPSKFPDIEAQLVKWLHKLEEEEGTTGVLSDARLRDKAKEISSKLGYSPEKFKASQGWVDNFKGRHGIVGGVWYGDSRKAKIARARGPGALLADTARDAALSPLNPAFETRLKAMDAGSSMPPPPSLDDDADVGLESEDDDDYADIEMEAHEPHRVQSSSGMLQPAWPPHLESSTSRTVSTSSTQSHSSSIAMHESIPQTSYSGQQHPPDTSSVHLHPVSVPSHPQTTETEHQSEMHPEVQHEGNYTSDAAYAMPPEMYQPVPPITSSGVPSMPEVEDSINKVIAFVESQGTEFITWEERQALGHIKNAIFQAASGVPYAREGR